MNRAMRSRAVGVRRRQQGISLMVVLILLLVMSFLGIAVLRSSAMQERMSANLRDRNEAMQAAEAGLRVAQETIVGGRFNAMWDGGSSFDDLIADPDPDDDVDGSVSCGGNGICNMSDADPANWDELPDEPTSWTHVDAEDDKSPRYGYLVEYLGSAKAESAEVRGVCNTSNAPKYQCERPLFRVTSYGRGRGMAQVVLQANIISQPR